MALPDLTGEKVNDTYQRLLQKSDDGQIVDGTGSAFTPTSLSVDGTTRTLYTSASFVYTSDNITQVTQSFEGGTQQITNITYTDSNPQTIAVTGSDGINKLYTIVYDGDNVSEIRVT